MENATKALIIAGSVLIVIALIAIGINILSSSSNVTNQVDEVSGSMGIAVFNSQFTDFEGVQTGAQVKALLNKVIATFRDGSSRVVNVNVLSGAAGLSSGFYENANTISTVRGKVQHSSAYKIQVSTGTDGYVNQITISKP